MIRAALVALTLTSALGLAACKQGEGDRCQIDSDCEEGLLCDSVGRVTTGGVCISTRAGDLASSNDSAPYLDLSTVD